MKIGILGSGTVGQQLGLGFIRLGHEVKIGSRSAAKLTDWINQAGVKASAGSPAEASKFGDIVVLATSWEGTVNAINIACKENFSGKILIDATNPLDLSQGRPPRIAVSPGNSGGEQIQKLLPEAKVVKAFNIISAYIMIKPKREEGDPDLFIAGNDSEAKQKVTSLAKGLGWKCIVDMGDISQSYWLETLAMMWIYYGFKNNSWSHAFKLLKK